MLFFVFALLSYSFVILCFMLKDYPPVSCFTLHFLSLSVFLPHLCPII